MVLFILRFPKVCVFTFRTWTESWQYRCRLT